MKGKSVKKSKGKKDLGTNPVLVVYVLDETGSMLGVRDATVSGFNEYVKSLQDGKNAKTAKMSFITFNSAGIKRREVMSDLLSVEPLSNKTYTPREATPLYDAIAEGITDASGKSKYDVLFVIHTDGEENSSQRQTRESVFKMIEEKKLKGWTFVFLGADQDAWRAGAAIGINKGATMSYDNTPIGTASANTVLRETARAYMNKTSSERNLGSYRFGLFTGDQDKALDIREDN